MNKVTIYCGVPGSGKSTLAEKLLKSVPHSDLYSADHYFVGEDGKYHFDPNKLPEAHAQCLRNYTKCIQGTWPSTVIVDNTNTSIAEIAPYAALALAYGWDLEIIILDCDPVIAHARNVHGVPLAAVQAMHGRLLALSLPPWWPSKVVKV